MSIAGIWPILILTKTTSIRDFGTSMINKRKRKKRK